MAAMEDHDLYWTGTYVCQIPEGGPSDEAVRLALYTYGNQVVETLGTHFFPVYLQVVEREDGTWLAWFCQAFDPLEPEASVMKRAVLREYVRLGEEARYL